MHFNPQYVFNKQPMVIISLGLLFGILVSQIIQIPINPFMVLLFLLFSVIFLKKWKYLFLVIFIVTLFAGNSLYLHYNHNFNRNLEGLNIIDDKKIEFEGIIVQVDNYITGQRFIVKNVSITTEESSFIDEIKFIVYPKNEKIFNASIGDTLIGTGKFNLFSNIRNPGEFNFKKYYHNKHIAGRVYSNSELIINHNQNWLVKKSIENFRENVRSKLTAYSDDQTASLLSALILGDRSKIDQDLRESFVNVGVVHVLAVSGLHVGYVLIILMILVSILRIPWGWDKLFIIIGLFLFALVSGGRPSVIRASIMASLYILAPLFNRRPNPWNIVAAAAFLILIVNPNAIYDLGFQLSFTTVISIIYFYRLINQNLVDWLRPSNIDNNVIRFLWSLFIVSLSAQIGTIPVVAYYFGRIPIIAVIANIIVIPLIGIFVALGLIKLIFFWIPPISFFMDQVSWLTKEAIYGSISIFDKVPFASLLTPQFSLIDLLIYISVIALGFAIFQRRYSKIVIFVILLLNLLIWPKLYTNKGIDIVFLDLGNNESTIIHNKNEKNILVNNGVLSMFSDDINRKIIPALKYLEIYEINEFIKSIGNSNNKVGSVKLVETISVENIWDTSFDTKSSFDNYLKNLTFLKGKNYNHSKRGDIIQINNNSYIQLLLPISNNSIEDNFAIKFVNGENSILLFNNLNNDEYKVLIDDDEIIQSNVLKMSYPKVLSAELELLVNTIDPDMTIISGKQTSKNNPRISEISEIIPNQLVFTDSVGAVWLFSDGINPIEVKDWKE